MEYSIVTEAPWSSEELASRLQHLLRENLKDSLSVDSTSVQAMLATGFTDAVYAMHAGELVGYAELNTWSSATGMAGYIDNVVVRQDFQGKGVGTRLNQALLDTARVRKLVKVHVITGESRTGALNLYAKLGLDRTNAVCFFLDL